MTSRRAPRLVVALAVGAVAAGVGPARAAPGLLGRLAIDVRTRLDDASARRVPVPVPPVPVTRQWRLTRLGSLDLGAPLVALAGADLDGDGRGELYAVTSREVIALAVVEGRLVERGRVAFGGDPAVPAPRDLVGAATVEGGALVATVSSWARSLRVTWQGGQLVGAQDAPGFAWCPGERHALTPGRNYFGAGAAARYGARCRDDLVDAAGHPLRVRAELAVTGALDVAVATCAPEGGACQPPVHATLPDIGVAFALADLDRDGTPEVIAAGAGAPGDPDVVKVLSLGTPRPRLRKVFIAGGVAGIAATDVDGDRVPDVVAAVRLIGATRVDLWRFE